MKNSVVLYSLFGFSFAVELTSKLKDLNLEIQGERETDTNCVITNRFQN